MKVEILRWSWLHFEVVWKTLHFDTYGVHELQVTYDSGQDYIDVEHMISLVYPESGGTALSVS